MDVMSQGMGRDRSEENREGVTNVKGEVERDRSGLG